MTSKKLTSAALAILAACTVLSSLSIAQHAPVQRAGRWLGHGYGNGYHRCNPLSDSSYYNPYSAHNSILISRSPLYLQSAAQHAQPMNYGRFHQGIPFSVYAAPAGSNISTYGNNFQAIPGQVIENSFEPYEEDLDDEDESDEDKDKDEKNNDTASIYNPDIIGSPLPTNPEKKSITSARASFKQDNSFQSNNALQLEPAQN